MGGRIVYASRIPPRRPRTLRTWLGSARNFGNTRFGRFGIFDFLTPKKNFRKKKIGNFFFGKNFGFGSVFHNFRRILEELGLFWRQNQIPGGFLLRMGGFSGPYKAWRQWLMINDRWLMMNDWWLMISDRWLMTDDYWLMIDDWWLLIDDRWLMINDQRLMANDWWLMIDD